MQRIIFTDLDGTLLDRDYSFEGAKPALQLIKRKKIPLVFCTSKTKEETEFWQRKMGINDPFITENGGAIYIPKGYFDFQFRYGMETDRYYVIELGVTVEKLKKYLKNEDIRHMADLGVKRVADITGLPIGQAIMAMKRKYSLPFVTEVKDIAKRIKGAEYTKGFYFHYIMKGNDKGKAVKKLQQLYRKKYGEITTLAVGDSSADLSMLAVVDEAYLVRQYDGKYIKSELTKISEKGPLGFSKAIIKFIKNS